MLHRQDPNLRTEGAVVLAKHDIAGATWRGLDLRPGGTFSIPDVRRFASFRAFPDTCGWNVRTSFMLALKLSFLRHGTEEELSSRVFKGRFQPITLPWPHDRFGPVDLQAEVLGTGPGSVFVANHRALSREWLYDLAIGTGVEIGPGPQPQILPGAGVNVSYVEQMPPQEWNELYNRSGKFPVRPELWGNYVVGEASDLPVDDGSLDFIFGSHVFEHLANPIGHLKRWKRKLAPGGKLICIVPDFAGTKDAVQERSTLDEWLQEYEDQLWLPGERHYVRHLRLPSEHRTVRNAIDRNESIHAHYYDNINCETLLRFAVEQLGYADYVIEHTPNHKDFHFVLKNG
jgi:SAM-dependent methyltransferase